MLSDGTESLNNLFKLAVLVVESLELCFSVLLNKSPLYQKKKRKKRTTTGNRILKDEDIWNYNSLLFQRTSKAPADEGSVSKVDLMPSGSFLVILEGAKANELVSQMIVLWILWTRATGYMNPSVKPLWPPLKSKVLKTLAFHSICSKARSYSN